LCQKYFHQKLLKSDNIGFQVTVENVAYVFLGHSVVMYGA